MVNQQIYNDVKAHILKRLTTELSSDLFYHCVGHTIDVERQAERIAMSEGGVDDSALLLLKIACLYHDSGFMLGYSDHEITGCSIAKTELSAFGLDEAELEMICGMIMATKIPQTPHNRLEEIICDADLDYLGRDDFGPISDDLYEELRVRHIVADRKAWDRIQVGFFRQHVYFTATGKAGRDPKKAIHLKSIEARL